MSSSPRRARAVASTRRTLSSRIRLLLWRFVRGLFILAAAIGPGPPPPPPPAPPPTEQVDESGGAADDAL
ncbi:MAG: hypothetical protein KF764_07435 [Labilithrix sp.]|nr:hypothetical protein [Labilithrix sp.]MBX3220268.1 hypothetical protein [Labilithrix sp.]